MGVYGYDGGMALMQVALPSGREPREPKTP